MNPTMKIAPAFIPAQLQIETWMIVKAYCLKLFKKA